MINMPTFFPFCKIKSRSNPLNRQGKEARLSGFSLFELLIVLLILGIISTVAIPGISRMLNKLEFRRQTQLVMATLRYARLISVSKGKEVHVVLDPDNNKSMLLSGAVDEIREFDFGEDGNITIEPPRIIFLAESHVTPATILINQGKRTVKIFMDPLTAMPIME